MNDVMFGDLTLGRALSLAGPDDNVDMARQIAARVSQIATEQATFKAWADRYDELYFSTVYTEGMGFDLWGYDPSATTPGRSHVSLTGHPAVYVDIPASLQAYEPVESMAAKEDSPVARTAANALERVRKAWKVEEKWQLKRHKAAVVKGLYGRTASFVYYDKEKKRLCIDIIQNPRNLWMGYRSDDYEELEWAATVNLVSPEEVRARYSVDLGARKYQEGVDTLIIPWVMGSGEVYSNQVHPELTYGPSRIEVWDYWYRLPAGKPGKRGEATKM